MDIEISTMSRTSCGLRELTRQSSLRNSFRRRREPVWIQNIRQQFAEQLKCLDFRLEAHTLMLGELQEFYRRRSEVEADYAHSMEKLVKQSMTRHKAERQKRDTWPGFSTYTMWQTLLGTTRKLGTDHGILGDLYSVRMAHQISQLADYVQRVYKRCREVVAKMHEDLLRVFTELHASMKTYQKYNGEFVQAETKLRAIEDGRSKLEEQATSKSTAVIRRKLRNLEKQIDKKQLKYLETQLKTTKARNDYLLCLEAANSSLQQYFSDDLHQLIDAIDFGYHDTFKHVLVTHLSAEDNMLTSRKGCVDLMNRQIKDLDQASDKQMFLDRFPQVFSQPGKFPFQPHHGDETCYLSVEETLRDDILDRMDTIRERLRSLLTESDQVSKTLEANRVIYLNNINEMDCDVSHLFQDGVVAPPPLSALDQAKQQAEKTETEELCFKKFSEHQGSSNLIARLQAKYDLIENALADHSVSCLALDSRRSQSQSASSIASRRLEAKRSPAATVRPKLFGGNIEDYIQATGESIPLIIRSCVQIINLHGMHHQGIFRISGSQKEINDFRNQFEAGKDPLYDKTDGKDIDSVAGVLKLYLRELHNQFFTTELFERLADFISHRNFTEPSELARSIYDIRHLLISSVAPSILPVMGYLFAFLNHLSEFSDENMMDPLNLAICLGPTLLPVPDDRDPIQFQGHVTELIKNMIIYEEDIFPRNDGGTTTYEKCLLQLNRGLRVISHDSLFDEEDLPGIIGGGDELELKEVQALYDFDARTRRELSFKKGDCFAVFEKVSPDWWEGVIRDEEGLVPDKYIAFLRQQDEPSYNVSGGGGRGLDRETEINYTPLTPPFLVSNNSSGAVVAPTPIASRRTLTQSNATDDVVVVDVFDGRTNNLDATTTFFRDQEMTTTDATNEADLPIGSGFVASTLRDDGKTSEELRSDIDAALADVFSGIQFLTRNSVQPESQLDSSPESQPVLSPESQPVLSPESQLILSPESRYVFPKPRPVTVTIKTGSKHRPDLVNDLPASSSAQCSLPKSSVVQPSSVAATLTDANRSQISEVTSGSAPSTAASSRKSAFRNEKANVRSKDPIGRPYSSNFETVKLRPQPPPKSANVCRSTFHPLQQEQPHRHSVPLAAATESLFLGGDDGDETFCAARLQLIPANESWIKAPTRGESLEASPTPELTLVAARPSGGELPTEAGVANVWTSPHTTSTQMNAKTPPAVVGSKPSSVVTRRQRSMDHERRFSENEPSDATKKHFYYSPSFI